MVGGQAPNALTSGDCPNYKEFPGEHLKPDRNGNVAGNGCRVCRPRRSTSRISSSAARFSWGAYMEDMGKPEPVAQGVTAPGGPPADLCPPGFRRCRPNRRRPQGRPGARATPGRVTPPGTTRSSTSTHSWTWGAVPSATCRSIASTAHWRAGRRTSRSSRRTCATRASRPMRRRHQGPRSRPGRQVPGRLGAQDPRLTGVQAGRAS